MFFSDAISRPLCHFLGYLYPAYQSYKAVQIDDATLHTQWLTYWIVNTYFTIFELFGDRLLSWLPMYYEAKIAMLVWLVTPRFQGASQLYAKIIAPYLLRYEGDIDQRVEELRQKSAEQLKEIGNQGIKHLRSRSSGMWKSAQDAVVSQMLNSAVDATFKDPDTVADATGSPPPPAPSKKTE